MIWITALEYAGGYKLCLRFNTGEEKLLDLEEKVKHDHRPIFRELADTAQFRKVYLNLESDTIEWPNGADLAPETLYLYNEGSILPNPILS